MKNLAPIVLFVYNRPQHTLRTLEALACNSLADESILYIYADGPKVSASPTDIDQIKETRRIIKQKKWCQEVHIIESETNKGLADSIIEGVTDIVNKYGRVIVLEDDIVTSSGFLKYMNDALNLYEKEEKVWHISAYFPEYKSNKNLPSTFFLDFSNCWGWGTWKRAWEKVILDSEYLYNTLKDHPELDRFNMDGANPDFFIQILKNYTGEFHTWFIKWNATLFLNNAYSLFPQKSLIDNIGWDGSGEHCDAVDRSYWRNNIVKSISVKAIPIEENKLAKEYFKNHYINQPLEKQKNFIAKIAARASRIMKDRLRKGCKRITSKLINFAYGTHSDIAQIIKLDANNNILYNRNSISNSNIHPTVKLYSQYNISNTNIGAYTYIAKGAAIDLTSIGKFCSIGPNLISGWGIHPTDGISTSPMFYSTFKQNGTTLSNVNKIEERKPIKIGNDVFIGMNVTILDGVSIGDGAVIGAGSIVSKDIPPYAIAVGSPIKIIKYRFEDETIQKLLNIQWWDWDYNKLKEVESMFWDVDKFINKHIKND